jgi:hypothetical protein
MLRNPLRSFLLGMGLTLGIAGCVRVEQKEYAKTRLMVAKDMHGVQLQWVSDKDLKYQLMYRDPENGIQMWTPIPKYKEVDGTGEMIVVFLEGDHVKNMEFRVQVLMGMTRERLNSYR